MDKCAAIGRAAKSAARSSEIGKRLRLAGAIGAGLAGAGASGAIGYKMGASGMQGKLTDAFLGANEIENEALAKHYTSLGAQYGYEMGKKERSSAKPSMAKESSDIYNKELIMSEEIEKIAEDIYGAAFVDELDKVAGAFANMAGRIESGISRAYNAAKSGAGRAYKATGAQKRMDNLASKVGYNTKKVYDNTRVLHPSADPSASQRRLGYTTLGAGAGVLAAGGLLTAGGIVGVKALKRALAKAPAKAHGIAKIQQLVQQHPRAAIGIGAGAAGLTGAGIYAANR